MSDAGFGLRFSGTSLVFRVLYISLHCADAFPPNEGHPKDSGKDKGLGFNVNIGWLQFVSCLRAVDFKSNGISLQDPPAVDADYINAFHHVVLPMAYEVRRRMVSADCHCDGILVQSWIRAGLCWIRCGRRRSYCTWRCWFSVKNHLDRFQRLGLGKTIRRCLFSDDAYALVISERTCAGSARGSYENPSVITCANDCDVFREATVFSNWTSVVQRVCRVCLVTHRFVVPTTRHDFRKSLCTWSGSICSEWTIFYSFRRSVRTINMVKEIHRPFWTSLFSIPTEGKYWSNLRSMEASCRVQIHLQSINWLKAWKRRA